MLEDRRQHQHRFAVQIGAHQPGIGDAELGPAGQYLVQGADARAALLQGYIQSGFLIEALMQGGVVAGELELVQPAQLQGHRRLG